MNKLLLLGALVACGDNKVPGTEDPPLPPGADGWQITVDMSGLDRFVPIGTETWAVGGHAQATGTLEDTADIAGVSVAQDDGDFANPAVAVSEGLTVVPIFVRDTDGHERKAHRTLMSAHFLPEGEINDRVMQLALSNQLLAAMNQLITDQAGSVNIADQVMAQEFLINDGTCQISPTSASQGPVVLELLRKQQTQLWFHFRLPDLNITFAGTCTSAGLPVRVAGEIGGTIDLQTRLDAVPPAAGEDCVSSFDHTVPIVAITDWVYDINSPDGPVQTILIRTLAPKSEDVRQMLLTGLRDGTDEALTAGLSNVDFLRQTQEIEAVPGRPIVFETCVASIGPVGGKIVIRMAGSAAGQGTKPAPGAPMLAAQTPLTNDNEFLLDTGLMTQLTFAMWRDGLFHFEQPQAFDVSLLGLLIPGLVDAFPNTQLADIVVDGELPPMLRAVPVDSTTGGDIRIELADLMVHVNVEGQQVVRVGLRLTMDLDFVATDGVLEPKVVATTAEATVLDELFGDAIDDAIEIAIESGIGQGLGDLGGLGGGGGLPEIIPGLGRITDISPDAGGRYLRVKFVPGATAAPSTHKSAPAAAAAIATQLFPSERAASLIKLAPLR